MGYAWSRPVRHSLRRANTPRESSAKSENLFLLSTLTPIITVFGIISYVSGSSFLARYYNHFGLTLEDANISVNGVLVHGISAMLTGIGRLLIGCYILVGALLILVRAREQTNRFMSLLVGIVILMLLPISSWLGGGAGVTAAEWDASDNSNLPNITISGRNPDLCRTGKLIGRKDNVYFISRIKPCEENNAESISTGVVTVLPSDEVMIDHYLR